MLNRLRVMVEDATFVRGRDGRARLMDSMAAPRATLVPMDGWEEQRYMAEMESRQGLERNL